MKKRFSINPRGYGMLLAVAGLAWLYHWRGGFAAQFLLAAIAFASAAQLLLFNAQGRRISVKRSGRIKAQAGDDVQIDVNITISGLLPVFWICLRDDWHQQWLFPGFKRSLHYTYTIENIQRGTYASKHIELRREDPLGLLRVMKPLESPLNFVVLPKPFVWDVRKSLRRASIEDEFNELRHYEEGDSLNRMQWKLSAKQQRWIVRDLSKRKSEEWMIYLDGAANSWSVDERTEGSKSKEEEISRSEAFERAVGIAAQFIRIVGKQAAIGVNSYGKKRHELPLRHVKPGSDLPELLARVMPDGNVPFHDVLRKEIPRLPNEAGVLCITSKLTTAITKTIVQLQKSGKRIVCIVCDENNAGISTYALKQLHAAGCQIIHEYGPLKGGAKGA